MPYTPGTPGYQGSRWSALGRNRLNRGQRWVGGWRRNGWKFRYMKHGDLIGQDGVHTVTALGARDRRRAADQESERP